MRIPVRSIPSLTLAALLTLLVLAAPLSAQRASDQAGVAEAEKAIAQLRSPYCPTMLETCTSPQAGFLRDSIYELARQGATSEELVEWMLANHGQQYRAAPQARGAGLWAWVIPPLAILTAAGLLLLWFRSGQATALATPRKASPALSEADRSDLTEAMKAWKQTGDEDS